MLFQFKLSPFTKSVRLQALIAFLCLLFTGASLAYAAEPGLQNNQPVDFICDVLTYKEQEEKIIAMGNVEMVQGKKILHAQKVIYDIPTDKMFAKGDVSLLDETGDVYFADEIEMTDQMKDAVGAGLRAVLVDGSRFKSKTGTRKGGNETHFKDADYTPCQPCKDDPDKDPFWQIKSSEVIHDKGDKTITYKHARLEFLGVPVAYTPYFSHADGTEKQKSGFLIPSIGFNDQLGTVVRNDYYWAIAPDKDATIGVIASTNEGAVVTGEYRQRFSKAKMELEGSATHSGRFDSDSGVIVEQEEELRGHLMGTGLWDINDKWRAGFNVGVTSDRQYMRQYDFSESDLLTNELYVERFAGRNYFTGRAMAFQDLRPTSTIDQPNILPYMETSLYGEPNNLLGGRWALDGNLLGLARDGNGQDITRLSGRAEWERHFVANSGIVTTAEASIRADFYGVDDKVDAFGKNELDARIFPQAHLVSRLPFVKTGRKIDVIMEPVVSLTLAPDVDNDDDIPNEDSQDAQADISNLFLGNRFPGYDRVDDNSRVTYGMRTGVYGVKTDAHAEFFVGQSYNFRDENNPFPFGSGFSEQASDIVGQVAAAYEGRHYLDYRFQLNEHDLMSQRHELSAATAWNRFSLGGRYLYAKEVDGTNIGEDREEVQLYGSLRLDDNWALTGRGTYDLGFEEAGLRTSTLGLGYSNDCFAFSASANRNLTDLYSGDSELEIMLRIWLKNLGEFETSAITLGGGTDN